MPPRKKSNTPELPQLIVKAIDDLKGENIVCLDLRKLPHAVCDFFIICSGNSTTQVEAISEEVYRQVKQKQKITPWHSEGKQNAQWILLDYIDAIVHVFLQEQREFYNLETLWADAEIITFNEPEKKKIVRRKKTAK